MEKKLPEKKFRAGGVSATIWENSALNKAGQPVNYKTISFDRSYKDKEDKWQKTNSLRLMDLPKAQLVLAKAFEYLSLSNGGNAVEEMSI